MAVTYPDILLCATELAAAPATGEARARAIVGRAYYAAYHHCRQWHAALPTPGRLPPSFRGGGMHAELAALLLNPDPSLTPALQTASRQRGSRLRALHGDRVQADYHLHQTVHPFEGSNAISEATQIIAI